MVPLKSYDIILHRKGRKFLTTGIGANNIYRALYEAVYLLQIVYPDCTEIEKIIIKEVKL